MSPARVEAARSSKSAAVSRKPAESRDHPDLNRWRCPRPIAKDLRPRDNRRSTGSIFLHSNPWTPAIGQWYHLAVVKRGNQYTFYRNGAADGTDSTAVAVPHVNYAMLMGRSEETSWLQGALDDVRLWKTALEGDQIHARMNTELTNSPASKRVWPATGRWTEGTARPLSIPLPTAPTARTKAVWAQRRRAPFPGEKWAALTR